MTLSPLRFFAPAATPEIDARQAHQEARIERDMARGDITRRDRDYEGHRPT